jgi:transcription termination factor NusA
MRELARWLSEAVSVVEGCGDADGELLVQQGITSLEDLSRCDLELLTQIPGIDEKGARAIQKRAAELAVEKQRSDEARVRAEAEAARGAAQGSPGGPEGGGPGN